MKKYDLIKEIISSTDTSKNKTTYNKKAYIYYKTKYEKTKLSKKDFIILEDLICYEIKPLLNIYGEVHKKIFVNDLIEYIKITGNHYKFFEFMTT